MLGAGRPLRYDPRGRPAELCPLDGIDRRGFLRGLVSGCGIAATMVAAPAMARAAERRALSLYNLHTGESLSACYYAAGCYRPGVMAQFERFLRDFRTGQLHRIDPGVLDILHALQSCARHDGRFEVISGYRSPATNAMLRRTTEGVARSSMHLYGRAIDVRLEGFPTHRLAQLARGLRRGGVGYYPVSDFVHVDTGRVRVW